jgi:hypothetical protein
MACAGHEGLSTAFSLGRLDVVEAFIGPGGVDLAHFLYMAPDILCSVCANGHTHVAQWLLDAGMVPWPQTWRNALFAACLSGNLASAQWVLHHGRAHMDEYLDAPFGNACFNGHLHVAKWLVSLGRVHVHASNNYAITVAAKLGNLHSAHCREAHRKGEKDPWDFYGGSALRTFKRHLPLCRWLVGLDLDDAAWPQDVLQALRFWSPARDVWMRCATLRARG